MLARKTRPTLLTTACPESKRSRPLSLLPPPFPLPLIGATIPPCTASTPAPLLSFRLRAALPKEVVAVVVGMMVVAVAGMGTDCRCGRQGRKGEDKGETRRYWSLIRAPLTKKDSNGFVQQEPVQQQTGSPGRRLVPGAPGWTYFMDESVRSDDERIALRSDEIRNRTRVAEILRKIEESSRDLSVQNTSSSSIFYNYRNVSTSNRSRGLGYDRWKGISEISSDADDYEVKGGGAGEEEDSDSFIALAKKGLIACNSRAKTLKVQFGFNSKPSIRDTENDSPKWICKLCGTENSKSEMKCVMCTWERRAKSKITPEDRRAEECFNNIEARLQELLQHPLKTETDGQYITEKLLIVSDQLDELAHNISVAHPQS